MVEDDTNDINISDYMYLVGKAHVFEDGDSIEIVQIKRRDSGLWVTFHIKQGPGMPRKLLLSLEEFSSTYGHLFKHD